MTVHVPEADVAYIAWRAAHPEGFVVNILARSNPDYFVIHRTMCKTITPGSSRNNEPGAFTERTYRKVVGDSIHELIAWGEDRTWSRDAMRTCRVCFRDGLPDGIVVGGAAARVGTPGRRHGALLVNDGFYDIDAALKELDGDTWSLPRGHLAAGDLLAFWRTLGSDGHRGVVAFGEVTGGPEVLDEPDDSHRFWRVPPEPGPTRSVPVRYLRAPNLPLWLDEDDTGTLAALAVSRGRGTQLFDITPEQWEALVDLAGGLVDRDLEPTADPAVLDARTARLRGRVGATPPPGQPTPQAVLREATTYTRDAAVRAWVLDAADGVCECCGEPAPFIGRDGRPYLEVHHVVTLADRGPDTTDNAVAVCPCCHRRLHLGADAATQVEALYGRVSRLRRIRVGATADTV
jgi:hypothetical protein